MIEVRRAADRFATRTGWLESRHCFSFGQHYDPANVGHGLLVVSNDDVVRAGSGFRTHPHRDMEIVTWVLDGELAHEDTLGNAGVIHPGLAQRMSAGTGIWHSELCPGGGRDVRFVQMWVLPDTPSADPSYEQLDVSAELDGGGLVAIASGRGHDAAISIRQRGATLWGGRLRPGETVAVPDSAHAHVYVARGSAALEGAGALAEGDSVRLTGAGSPALTAGEGGAEVLVWETT
ncbi:MAG TPA: pirin family protein [Frankiaceae bacterium]|nr:pirin family protein [Frankiaceae bacterium]